MTLLSELSTSVFALASAFSTSQFGTGTHPQTPTPQQQMTNTAHQDANAPETSHAAGVDQASTKPLTPTQDQSSDEIVVTANKRVERLQDTAEAASVLSSQLTQRLNVTSFQDYASLVPNLNQAGGAGIGTGTIVIRGLNTGPASLTNTTAVYIDEAPFTQNGGLAHGSQSTPDPDLVDIDRVEVLKGPQGTLYGASSLGGLIRIIPKEPSVDASGISGHAELRGDVTEGGNAGYAVRGSIYAPVVPGGLAIGLAGFSRRDPGFITNVRTGRDNVGQSDVRGGSASIVARPFDNLTIRGRIMIETGEQIGQIYQQNVSGSGTPLYGERKQSTAFDEGISLRYELYEAVAEYKTPFGSLIGTYSHTLSQNNLATDFTPTYSVLLVANYPRLIGGPPPQGAYLPTSINTRTNANNFEARFTSRRFGPIDFIVGVFHTDQDNNVVQHVNGLAALGAALPVPFNNFVTLNEPTSYRETAVFGDATVYLTPRLDVTGGLRYTENRQGGFAQGTGLLFGAGLYVPGTAQDSKTLYQANLRWRPTETLSLFARTATGYRPGGAQTNPLAPNPTYAPDTLTDYEIGAKGSFLDRRLSYDASVYYMDWKNLQLNSSINGILFVGNAGAARVKGVELQANYAVSRNIGFGGAFGYNDAALTQVAGSTAAAIGANPGDRLPASPRFTGSLFGDYRFSTRSGIEPGIGATIRYQGNQISSFPGDKKNVAFTTPSYVTLDLRTSVKYSRFTLSAVASNITDKNGYTGYTTSNALPLQGVPSQAFLVRPRTVMITVATDF